MLVAVKRFCGLYKILSPAKIRLKMLSCFLPDHARTAESSAVGEVDGESSDNGECTANLFKIVLSTLDLSVY